MPVWRGGSSTAARRRFDELTANADAVASRHRRAAGTRRRHRGHGSRRRAGAAGTPRASPARRGACRGRDGRSCRDRAGRGRGRGLSRRCAPNALSPRSSASRPNSPPAPKSFATSACDCARSAAISTASSRRWTPSRERSKASRNGCRRSQTSGDASPLRRTRSCSRWPPTPRGSSARRPSGGDPVEAARRAVERHEEHMERWSMRSAPSARRNAKRLGRGRRRRARVARDGGGRVPRRAARARGRADRRRRGDVPHPPQRRPSVRADRGHGFRRRAVAHRARARGGRRRRDARLRRDRRGNRWRDGTRRRGDAPAARRACAGADDHPPAADRERRRQPLPGGEDRRRPHAHAHRGARRSPPSRGDRADGGRRGVHRDACEG